MRENTLINLNPGPLGRVVSQQEIQTELVARGNGQLSRFHTVAALIVSGIGTIVSAQLAAADWLSLDGWIRTYFAYAILICIACRHSPVTSTCLGFFFGFMSMGTSFWWAEQMLAYSLNTQGLIPRTVFVALILWESIPFAVFTYLIASLRRVQPSSLGLLISISVWILIGTFWPRVFPWEIGHTQLACLPLAQIADLGGGPMITWVVLWCAAIPQLLMDWRFAPNRQRRKNASRAIALVAIMLLLDLGYGYYQILRWNTKMETSPVYTVGCIQENPADVNSISRLRAATNELNEKVDVVCWPESTLGTHSQELKSFRDLLEVARASLPPVVDTSHLLGLPAPLIVGGKSFSGPKNEEAPYQQTAFVVDATGHVLSHYHKRGLMPLGEYVPGEQYIPKLHEWFQLGNYFIPGVEDGPVLMPDGTKLGILICYEDISPNIARRTCLAGAEAFICIINASAFEQPIALYQHLRLAQLRTIENRRHLVRIAGTGISCTIKPTGEMIQMAAPYESTSFIAKINRFEDQTHYSYFGNVMFWLCVIIVVVQGRTYFKITW